MAKDDIQRMIRTTQRNFPPAEHFADSRQNTGGLVTRELEEAAACAVARGEPISAVAAATDLAPLAVLDALEAAAEQRQKRP